MLNVFVMLMQNFMLTKRSPWEKICVTFKFWKESESFMVIMISFSSWGWSEDKFPQLFDELSLVHRSNISIRTRSIRKQSMTSPLGLAKTKQQEFFFVSSFVRLLAHAWTMILCLCLRRSLGRRLDFIPLFCLLFCPYAYAYSRVNQALISTMWNATSPTFESWIP